MHRDTVMNSKVNTGLELHTDEQRKEAVLSRDASADDRFVYAVKTTGIYCRPSASSRLPKRKNVEFFANAQDAEAAGYRASRRVKADSDTAASIRSALVVEACRLIDNSETQPNLDALAAQVGMSKFHFHRVFKAETGLTPK